MMGGVRERKKDRDKGEMVVWSGVEGTVGY